MVPAGVFYWWSYADWDPWARLQSSQRCARECEAVGDVLNMAMARIHVGWALVALGAFEDAEQVLTEDAHLRRRRAAWAAWSPTSRTCISAPPPVT